MAAIEDELRRLMARVAELEGEVARLRARPEPAAADPEPVVTRRGMLGRMGAAAVAGAAAGGTLLSTAPAGAVEGTMRYGDVNDAGTESTTLRSVASSTLFLENNQEGGAKTLVVAGDGVGIIVDAHVMGLQVRTTPATGVETQGNDAGLKARSPKGVAVVADAFVAEEPNQFLGTGVRATGRTTGVQARVLGGPNVHPNVGAGVIADGGDGYAGVRALGRHGVVAHGNDTGVKVEGGRRGVDALAVGGIGVRGECVSVSGDSAGTGVEGVGTVGVRGRSAEGVGVAAEGGRAPLWLKPSADKGAPTTGKHSMGEVRMDSDGALWACVVSGTPGEWRRVSYEPAG